MEIWQKIEGVLGIVNENFFDNHISLVYDCKNDQNIAYVHIRKQLNTDITLYQTLYKKNYM